jgi:hypothetical protein
MCNVQLSIRSALKRFAIRIATLLFLAAILIWSAAPAFAQMNTAELSGLVKDPSGAAIPNAAIEAVEANTQMKYTAVSNDSGEFLLPQLPVGEYRLTVNAKGFKQAVQPKITVHAGDNLRQTFSMELGEQTELVTVTGEGGLLQVESAAIKDTIQQQQVIDLPLKGRNFIDLVGLTPGVTNPPAGTRGSALQQTGQVFAILGQRSGHNLYLIDGSSVTDQAFNNNVLNPSVDFIQEVTVNQTSYDAEFGGKSGGVINVITKSGSNRWHGSLFEFVRNDFFDAKNFFASPTQPTPAYKQNQFGGSIGGPIRKDKTFFFMDYEGLRVRKAQTQLFTVPTDAERAGNFTGTGITVNIPGTTTMFPNDTIPTIDPVAAAILARVPHASNPSAVANNLLATDVSTIGVNQYDLRVDHVFSTRDTVFARGSIFDDNEFDPFGLGALNETLLPGFGYNLRTHADNVSATWTHIFSTSWLNELRFGWMWVGGGQVSPNAGTNLAAQTGLQGVTTNPLDTGYPQVSVTNFTTMGEPTQYVSRKDNDYEIYDNVIWHHGTHTMKFGGYFFKLDFEPVDANNARGMFQFINGKYTGNALGDFLLGAPNMGTVGVLGRGTLQGRTTWIHLYIEDGWQITANLKLDIGLRYEYNQNMTDANNNMAIVNTLIPGGQFVIASNDAGQISPAATALLSLIPITHVTSAQAGWDRSLLQGRPLRLAPRLGLAWSLPDRKTVVRSGFGIYTNQAAYNIIQNAALNLPFYYPKLVTNSASCATTTICNTENILAANATGTVAANNLSHNFKIEYNDVWNLAIEHSFSSATSFQAEYIGSYTVHADNQALQNLFPNSALAPGAGHVRPIPQMAGFTTISWDGWEKYNALALTFKQRVWHGLTLQAVYTWSHALDDASNPGADNAGPNVPQDMDNYAAESASSDFDHRHRFVTNFVYQTPSFDNSAHWARSVFGGWQLAGIWTLQSGSPFTVNLPNDNANNGTPVFSQRPNYVCDPNNGPKTTAMWFSAACFAQPAAFTYGTAGRDSVIGPGLDSFDASFQKNFPLREDMKLQFRVDMFDFFNHPNFNQPNRIFSAAANSPFGTISSAQDPRVMQFSLRFAF